MNIWKITYLNCGERYEFRIDHRSYTHNLSICEIIRHKNGAFRKRSLNHRKRRLCVLVWRENILKRELSENDNLVISLSEILFESKSKMIGDCHVLKFPGVV